MTIAMLSNECDQSFPDIIGHAKTAGALVASNASIRQLSARQDQFRVCLAKIDILIVNRHEASALVPWLHLRSGEGGPILEHRSDEELPDLARRGLSAGGFELSLPGFFGRLHEQGPRWVVVTDGRDGA